MARHHPRFFTKLWLGMGAATGLTIMMSTPASAETIDLICSYQNIDLHVFIDPDRQSVVNTIEDKRYGPFAASISDTLIRWTERSTDWEHQYTIDRVAGTIRHVQIYRGNQHADLRGQCRRATQKF